MGNVKIGVLGPCVLGLTLACSSSKPRPTDPAEQGARAVAEGDSSPDLTPVSAPADLFVVGRLRNPAEFLDVLGKWSKVPLDWRSVLAKEEPGVERVLKLDTPIDVAAVLNANRGMRPRPPSVAVSFGLTSVSAALEFARRRGEAVRRLQTGAYALGEAPSQCVIADAAGNAPARLVCGGKEADVQALWPYMTRGMPRESLGTADLHVELRGDPVRTRYGRDLRQLRSLIPLAVSQLALDIPRFDRATGDALHAIADEVDHFVQDFERFDLDVTLQRAADVTELRASGKFRSQSSWATRALFDSPAAAAPDVFWRLPKDALSARFAHRTNVQRYTGIRRTVAELVDALLEYEKMPPAVRDQVADLITEAWKTDAAWATADGAVPENAKVAELSGPELERERMRRRVGWHVGVFAAKADPYIADIGKLAKLYNNAQLRRAIEKRAKTQLKNLPTVRQRKPRGGGLPAAAVAFEVTIPGVFFEGSELPPAAEQESGGKRLARRAGAKGKPLGVVLVIVPDAERTWLGVSADEALLVQKISALRGNESDTLASREGLSDLKPLPVIGGGFVTVAALANQIGGETLGGSSRVLNAVPHHGETPIPFIFTAAQGTATWSARIPKAALEDLGGIIPAAAGASGALLPSTPSGASAPSP
jgi:hypothetical protein